MPEKAKTEIAGWIGMAAGKIHNLCEGWRINSLQGILTTTNESKIKRIEAIIAKYCPEEYSEGLWAKMCVTQQAAEKLVEACKVALIFIEKTCRSAGLEPKRSLDYIIIQTALAEYEKVTK